MAYCFRIIMYMIFYNAVLISCCPDQSALNGFMNLSGVCH